VNEQGQIKLDKESFQSLELTEMIW